MEKPHCPICRQFLTASGLDERVYYCSDAATTHATIHFDLDGKIDLQILDIGPYSITITNSQKTQSTVIRKHNSVFKETVLELSTALELPWHNKKQVMEKIALYLLFS